MSNPFEVSTVRCAGPGCEAVRRSVNHWYVVFVDSGGTFVCYPYDKMALVDDRRPVCGSACAQKLFEQFLSRG